MLNNTKRGVKSIQSFDLNLGGHDNEEPPITSFLMRWLFIDEVEQLICQFFIKILKDFILIKGRTPVS